MTQISFKKIIFKIHLWLGVISGLLVFLVSISGAMYAFKDEIFNAIYKEYMHVDDIGKHTIPLDSLRDVVQTELGDEYPISYVNTYNAPNKAWLFKAYQYNPDGITYFSYCKYDFMVWVNPYSGEILKILDHKYEFFHLVKMFHWSFLLSTKVGQPIVGYTVLVFVLSLITGLIWWWPGKFRSRKRAFTIRWKGKAINLNHDLHVVLGFYSIPLSLLLSLTGLVWAFKWFMAIVYVIFSFTTEQPNREQAKASAQHLMSAPFETIYQAAKNKHPEANSISIYNVNNENRTIDTYTRESGMTYYDAHLESYDATNGKLLSSRSFDDLNNGEKAIYMNYDIHTGAIWGIFGKILAFIGALISAMLPVTGYIMWIRKKLPKRKSLNLY